MSIIGRVPGYLLPAESVGPAGYARVDAPHPPSAPSSPRYYIRPAGQTSAPSSGVSGWTIVALLGIGFVIYEVGSYYLDKAKQGGHRGRRAHYRY